MIGIRGAFANAIANAIRIFVGVYNETVANIRLHELTESDANVMGLS